MPKLTDAEKARRWRERHPERYLESKRRYYASEKGKAQKKRSDAAYVASGGRAETEARRAAKPLSEPRKAARKKWAEANKSYFTTQRSMRRALESRLNPFEFWVLGEAVALARLREKLVGGSWHVDHIVPVSKGGTSQPHNLQVVPACWNRRKSNKHSGHFFAHAKEMNYV